MSDIQEIYQYLMEKEFSEEELNNEIKKKISEFHGFITEQGALFLIAKEKGVKIQSPDIDPDLYSEIEKEIDYNEFIIPISEIQEGMSNIVVLGKITNIFQIHSFTRKDGTTGIVGSFILAESSGTIKIILWGEHAKIMDSEFFQKGEILRVIGGYSKKSINERLEIHVGKKGRIVLSPTDISKKIKNQLESNNLNNSHTFLNSQKNTIKIKDICRKEGFLNYVIGLIHIEEFKEFNKNNGEKSFLLRFSLNDDTGSINVIVWDFQAIEMLSSIKNNMKIIIMNTLLRINNSSKEKELHYLKNSSFRIF